jgi:LPXTG-motif cell wall-anchored protein
VQVTDDLAAVFAGVADLAVAGVASPELTVNPDFDGDTDIALLSGTGTLPVGGNATVAIAVTVAPGAALGPFRNVVAATAETPSGTLITATADAATEIEFEAASAEGTVWWDANRNGAKDPDEQLIGGVTVNLWDVDGNLVATTVTSNPSQQATESSDRVERAPATSVPFNYQFDGIDPGAVYSISLNETTFPSGFTLVSTQGGQDGLYVFLALSGVLELDLDFGLDVDDTTLPRTGADADRTALYGLVLLMTGSALLLLARRRRNTRHAV